MAVINAEKARLEAVYGKNGLASSTGRIEPFTGKKFAAQRNKVEEDLEIKKKVQNAQSLARVSVSRINRQEHRRISKRSVDDMLLYVHRPIL